ncbi:hypothetical protein MKX01_012568 [Papaver californicum]|nr:hypothetical protein MKX01_012568 [Papaver californicum]
MSISSMNDILLPHGLPVPDLNEAPIESSLKYVNLVQTLADLYRRLENSSLGAKSDLYLEQFTNFWGVFDPRSIRRSLRTARQHAVDVHLKVVISAWLRYERREDELIGVDTMECRGRVFECPKSSLEHGCDPDSVYDKCPCRHRDSEDFAVPIDEEEQEQCSTSNEDGDVSFCIGDEEIRCVRYNIASLSRPLKTMLYGGFIESRRETISFSHNEISAQGMRAVEIFSRTQRLDSFSPTIV